MFTIRRANEFDYPELGEVMFDAVRNGESRYSEGQREAWVPEPRNGAAWSAHLAPQQIVAAEAHGRLADFMSLAPSGYIDFAYIRPEARGSGLFRQLYTEIEQLARQSGKSLLWVHASLMAGPAFEAVGFTITKKEIVEIGDQNFERFEMEKPLGPPRS